MKLFISILIMHMFAISTLAFDSSEAKSLEKLYATMTQNTFAKTKLFIKPGETMKMIREKKNFFVLDVRTKGEYGVVSLGIKNSVHIPLDVLFKKENLQKIPSDKTIIVVCTAGSRALMAGLGLRDVGFTNIRVLKGGLAALTASNNPKNAPWK